MTSITKKTAFITGGSKGLGRAIAFAFIQAGIHVSITGRDNKRLKTCLEELKQNNPHGVKITGFQADVTSYSQLQQAVEDSLKVHDKIDIVIANAGFWQSASIDELTVDLWNKTIATNLSGVFYTLKSTLPALKVSKGYLFSISSLLGANFAPNCSAHVAAKFGVTGFTQAAMLDLRQYGIKTSTIMPGSIATHYTSETPKADYEWKIQPEDIAKILLNLIAMPARTLPSKVEVRPSFPPQK